ncbi:MAG: hypothetical protein L3J96_08065, partial [Thermoplasmata archaeon]|nr:hypothetical protein [Thermoplasmata archaeon]
MSSGSASGSTSRRIRVRAMFLVVLVAGLTLASYAALPAAFGNAPAVPPAHAPLAKEGPAPSKSAAVVAPHTVARAPSLPANWAKPHVAFHVPGPHPGSWGGATPPGAPMPVSGASGSGGVNWSQLEQRCYGVWPTRGGQAQYYEQCYGHDEPGLAPYSNLTGSGGNVSWQVQLPVDRGPTQNQSDLYSAIWFGMTLNDPYAWMNQCFLELQFYPDSSWTAPSGTVDGLWVGAAVAWQIEATSGAENPCYYGVLTQQGSPGSFFTMTQGDAINVTMTGWSGDSFGENLTITDVTSGQVSSLNLYNGTGNYPLDPAYTTDSWSNSLWWTPGGETPVSFAFETGHAGNPSFPSNNTFGGCSPGAPPSTGANPAVPCPSYDPSEWANDTLSPWEIAPPVFFNSASRVQAAQVGFTQDLGGLAFIDGSDIFGSFPYTCLGHETSGFCSYPWYSYSCAEGAYNFGATDYGTSPTSVDFGKATEYGTRVTVNAAGLGYYPPGNHSVPTCGGTSSALTIINP